MTTGATFAGGSFRITSEPLDAARVHAAVASPGAGGVVVFVGSVRDVNDGRAVVSLRYEAYTAMALAELERIGAEARRRWPGTAVAAEHRTGELAVGEQAVIVAAAHAHRGDAFAACRYVVEELKRRVPIWKEERYTDGGARWLGSAEAR